jgi:hypothetical protein
LLDLDQSSATVVINARDDKGRDLSDVAVTVDGDPLVDKLDGKPVAIDPGAHALRFSAAGFASIEEDVVIHAAEKNRPLHVQFGGPSVQSGAAIVAPVRRLGTAPSPKPEGPASGSGAGGVPVGTWIFGGLAVAALGSEAYFGVSGLSQRSSDLAPGGCAPHCSPSEKSEIETKFVIADVSLGVAVVSAGLAAFFLFKGSSAKPSTPPPVTLDFSPIPGGGAARLSRQV